MVRIEEADVVACTWAFIESGAVDYTRSLEAKFRESSDAEAKECVEAFKSSIEIFPKWLEGACKDRGLVLGDVEKGTDVREVEYDVSRCLGNGAGGAVYALSDPILRRCVKVNSDCMRRPYGAVHERNILLGYSHPHIVRGFKAWMDSNCRPCIEMERALYGSLCSQTPDPEAAPWVARQLWSAMTHLHSMGIVHADIRPANILVFEHQNIKLCDFELAMSIRAAEIKWYHFDNASLYHAPEGCLAYAPVHIEKIDWWGVGATVYGMIHKDWTASPYTEDTMIAYVKSGALPEIINNDHPVMHVLRLDPESRSEHEFVRWMNTTNGEEFVILHKSKTYAHPIEKDDARTIRNRRMRLREGVYAGERGIHPVMLTTHHHGPGISQRHDGE